jgi:predicted nucleic acid-binding protein
VVFIDSNIPMYLVGAAHPNKDAAALLLRRLIDQERRLVTDAEVLQEILHRYVAIGRRDAIQPALDAILRVVDEVFAIDHEVVESAKRIVMGSEKLSARDAVHAAVMERHEVREILTFDRGFDAVPGIARVTA